VPPVEIEPEVPLVEIAVAQVPLGVPARQPAEVGPWVPSVHA
jgi:hypothetical protein